MGAIDASFIGASIWKGRYKRQFRRPLPSDCHRHLRTETRSIAAEGADCIRDRAAVRDEHVRQEASAIRRRRNVLDEQSVDAIARIPIFEREVSRSLHLPAELPGPSWCLPVTRPA